LASDQTAHLAAVAPGLAPIVAGLPVEILVSCAIHYQGVRPTRTSRPFRGFAVSFLHSAL